MADGRWQLTLLLEFSYVFTVTCLRHVEYVACCYRYDFYSCRVEKNVSCGRASCAFALVFFVRCFAAKPVCLCPCVRSSFGSLSNFRVKTLVVGGKRLSRSFPTLSLLPKWSRSCVRMLYCTLPSLSFPSFTEHILSILQRPHATRSTRPQIASPTPSHTSRSALFRFAVAPFPTNDRPLRVLGPSSSADCRLPQQQS
jgi:hypothetical protein